MAAAIIYLKERALGGAKLVDLVNLASIDFDVTTEEGYQHSTDWTSFPVEDGIDVTDNANLQPDELTLSGVISDSPLVYLPYPDRSRDVYETLLAIRESKALLTVITGLAVMTDMGLTGITVNRNRENGQSIRPTLSLRKVRKVFSLEVPIPPALLKPVVRPSGASPANAGVQPTEDLGDAADPTTVVTEELGALDLFGDKSIANGLYDKWAP